jgi:hypothetical protein
MRKRLLIALPAALVLMAGTALWVRAAENETGMPACADVIAGDAEYAPPERAVSPPANTGWILPDTGTLFFNETLAAPSCLDVQYGIVVLSENPAGGAPTVLASEVVPGDGLSTELNFDMQVSTNPAEEEVCVYLYTVGSSGATTTTPSNGNPHSQTIASPGTELLDRAPDGNTQENYCHPIGGSSPARSYN